MTSLGSQTCYGAVPQSTVTSILMTVIQQQLPPTAQLLTVDHSTLVRSLVRAAASHLLQLVKPHALLQQVHAGLHLPEAYLDFYLHKQEHYNLKQLLDIVNHNALPEFCLEALPDQPECSSAAAEVEDQQVLLNRAPEQKWVIFTCTTPDLEMVPAGMPPVYAISV